MFFSVYFFNFDFIQKFTEEAKELLKPALISFDMEGRFSESADDSPMETDYETDIENTTDLELAMSGSGRVSYFSRMIQLVLPDGNTLSSSSSSGGKESLRKKKREIEEKSEVILEMVCQMLQLYSGCYRVTLLLSMAMELRIWRVASVLMELVSMFDESLCFHLRGLEDYLERNRKESGTETLGHKPLSYLKKEILRYLEKFVNKRKCPRGCDLSARTMLLCRIMRFNHRFSLLFDFFSFSFSTLFFLFFF